MCNTLTQAFIPFIIGANEIWSITMYIRFFYIDVTVYYYYCTLSGRPGGGGGYPGDDF